MLLSLFTPTHRPDYLNEAYQSLVDQTYKNWEWVIVSNAGAQIPEFIRKDPRVKVFDAPDYMPAQGIGALKRFACERCAGEVFIELDHDDLLHETALQRIVDSAKSHPGGFYYSDFANFYPDGSCQIYEAGFGWENYHVEWKGKKYTAMKAFAPDASGLAAIFYAPNHVRAWHRDAYWAAGGHSPLLSVCDDYDLVCKTYLAKVPFVPIRECLYFYRMQAAGSNTFLLRNQEIQDKQQQVSNQYIYQLIEEWCRRQALDRIDLGGGHNCPPGFKSLDFENADVLCDLRNGIPLPDNSVGCVRAYDFLEHIPHCQSVGCNHGADRKGGLCTVGMMNEIYRVLAPGGWLISRTPSTDGRGAFQDPTHASFWNPNSFWYYTRREQANFLRGMTARFQANRLWQSYPSNWHEAHKILYVFADLVALKGQRQAGICEI